MKLATPEKQRARRPHVELQRRRVAMNVHDRHPSAFLVEVHVVGDDPWLVRLDESRQLGHSRLELVELPRPDFRVVDVIDHLDTRTPHSGRSDR
jgi:hypothetical protein